MLPIQRLAAYVFHVCTELTVILHSPPRTSGSRTLRRVETARNAIGCERFEIVNLFASARWSVNDKSLPETVVETRLWRLEVERNLTGNPGGDVLLAYGVQEPAKPDRARYREKLTWIETLLAEQDRQVWMLGERPHHPSRWQRVTFRERPTMQFDEAVHDLLAPIGLGPRKP